MSKHILFVSYDGMTDPLGQSQVLPYLIGLRKEGFNISLLSFEKAHKYKENKALITKICSDNQINWFPLEYTKRPPVLSTMIDVRKMKKQITEINKEHKIDLLHCRSYISAIAGLYFQKKWNLPWIFDMRGFWADERVEGKIWSLKNPLYKIIYNFFKKKEKEYFSQSSAIISLTHNGKDEILSWGLKHVDHSKITVIPCCVDLDKFDRNKIILSDVAQLQNELHLTGKKVLGYVGSIGTWYMLDEMLLAFKGFLNSAPSLHFLFVSQENESVIKSKAAALGIETTNITVVSAQHHKVPLYISLFDYSIFYIKPSFSKKASSPTKQGELMAMGIPIVCNPGVGDTEFVIKKYSAGALLETNMDTSTIVLSDLMANFNAEKSIEGAKDFYSLNQGVERYKSVYETCLLIGK